MIDHHSAESLFNDCNERPPQSAKFYLRDLEIPGSGLKGIVYNALSDLKK